MAKKETGFRGHQNLLDRLMIRNGWTQADFAKKAGLNPKQVSELLNGKPVSITVIRKAAECFGLKPFQVVDESERDRFEIEGLVPEDDNDAKPPSNLPPDLPLFVGREAEIKIIRDILSSPKLAVQIAGVKGMGGVGKTSLAIHVASSISESFADGSCLVNLEGMGSKPVTPESAMRQVLAFFKPDMRILSLENDVLRAEYATTLSAKSGALIILDNAADTQQVLPLLNVDGPRFLVTGRRAITLDRIHPVPLDVFAPDESQKLLESFLKYRCDEKDMREIAKACGHLPLALRVAGIYLKNHTNWTTETFLKTLQDEKDRSTILGSDDPAHDIEGILRLSAVKLRNECHSLALFWSVLATINSGINLKIATQVYNSLNSQDNRELVSDQFVNAELTRLIDRSLLTYHSGNRQFMFHDLIRPIAKMLYVKSS